MQSTLRDLRLHPIQCQVNRWGCNNTTSVPIFVNCLSSWIRVLKLVSQEEHDTQYTGSEVGAFPYTITSLCSCNHIGINPPIWGCRGWSIVYWSKGSWHSLSGVSASAPLPPPPRDVISLSSHATLHNLNTLIVFCDEGILQFNWM